MKSHNLDGYQGKVLRVDLTQGHISEEYLEEAILESFLGGVGIGAYYLYREVPPSTRWSDPRNCLILAAGPLNIVRMSGAGTFSVTTKGALTEGAASSQANGFLGAYLRSCGLDAIVVAGKAEKLVYLHVHGGFAELRNAEHLRGEDTWETEDLIKKELGKTERELSVYSIGPAGENLVRFACLVGDKGHVAAHNGIGAVAGSKNLKAIAVSRGNRTIALEKNKKLNSLAQELSKAFKKSRYWVEGTSLTYGRHHASGQLAVRNYTTSVFPEYSKFSDGVTNYGRAHFESTLKPCFACGARHCHIMKVTEGPYSGYVGEEPEYEQWAAWSSLIGQTDPGAAVMLANEVDRLGMDNNEAGWIIAWLMECFEKGFITATDLDGNFVWGDTETVRAMLRRIAFREEIGDLLAEGIKRASKEIGGDPEACAVCTVKGNTPRSHDHRANWWELFDTCVSNTGTIETHRFFKREQVGLPGAYDPYSPEEVSTLVAKTKGSMQFEDSLVLCRFTTGSRFDLLCGALNEITGWSFDTYKAVRTGRRIVNLLKVFNLRHGIPSTLDYPSKRYGSTPTDGPAKGKLILSHWHYMLRNYYKHMGWDVETGKPLPETLRSLGLEHVIADIWA